MANGLGLSIGRVRVTKAVSPGEPGYIRSVRIQTDHMVSQLLGALKGLENITAEGMAYALEPVMELSQELVPVDKGVLKRSGFIEVRKLSRGPVAVIGYAKHGIPHYAAFVHEMIHIPHQKGKQAKFLEAAAQQRMGRFKRRLVNYMKEQSGLG